MASPDVKINKGVARTVPLTFLLFDPYSVSVFNVAFFCEEILFSIVNV